VLWPNGWRPPEIMAKKSATGELRFKPPKEDWRRLIGQLGWGPPDQLLIIF
jgi:hypothetical protein